MRNFNIRTIDNRRNSAIYTLEFCGAGKSNYQFPQTPQNCSDYPLAR
jgi:hypothetical protein